jgi:signal transduction histidine kinase
VTDSHSAYAAALERYVSRGDEEALSRAEELGYEMLSSGSDSMAVISAHLESLRTAGVLEKEDRQTEASARRRRFLVAALRPFSVTRLRYEHANEELERVNEAFVNRTQELEAANAELETFNFLISHDLRTSLQAILGFAQTISARHRRELSSEAIRFLDMIVESARDMGELIDDLLAFSRAISAPLEYEQVDIEALARDALSELEPQLADRKIELVIRKLPRIEGDRVLLKRVLVNLLANAIKFTSGRAKARIEIGSRENDGVRAIFVRDNGVGFDMKQSDRLFRPFERLHNCDEFEGTGIGLALVERIVSRHGGKVWAESTHGEGATFFFTLGEFDAVGAGAVAAAFDSDREDAQSGPNNR